MKYRVCPPFHCFNYAEMLDSSTPDDKIIWTWDEISSKSTDFIMRNT